jgi:hypothetical protein
MLSENSNPEAGHYYERSILCVIYTDCIIFFKCITLDKIIFFLCKFLQWIEVLPIFSLGKSYGQYVS